MIKKRQKEPICIIMNNQEKNTYSKDELLKATISLLSTKGLKDVSISELTSRANVSRATFYRNFNSIEDILIRHHYFLANDLEIRCKRKNVSTIADFFYELTKHQLENKTFYTILYKENLLYVILETILTRIKSHLIDDSNIEKYGLNFISFGLFGFIYTWIKDDMNISPEELLELIKKHYSANTNINDMFLKF